MEWVRRLSRRPGATKDQRGSSRLFPIANVADDAGGSAGDNSVVRHVSDDHSAGADHRAATDAEIGEDCGIRSDRGAGPHQCAQHFPIGLALKPSSRSGSAWIKVIDEFHPVADKNPIFDDDTVGNEDVRLDLASRPYDCSPLYLDKGPNSRVVAYRGSIYINELRMIDPDAFTKLCRWMDRQC